MPRYTDARPLGEGSFAVVFAAQDSLLGRAVAVKVLRADRVADATARLRFAREIRMTALVGTHPHVVTVHDAGEWHGRPYLVMELLEGSIADRLRRPVPERLALRWLAQAAAALDFVHSNGVVHRDVKPANLLLDARGDVRLADFGVARGGTRDLALTDDGAVVGTPGYLAPEVAVGGIATPASDRYSFAVVAAELVGDRPALARAFADDPAHRYATAAALVAALGGSTDTTRVLHRPLRKIEPIPRTQLAPPIGPVRRRRRAVGSGARLLGAATLAAAAAAGGALAAVRLQHESPATAAAQPRQTCALSTLHHNANVVLTGVGAGLVCRRQAHVLRLQGDEWTYRSGRELFVPDPDSGSPVMVCALRRAAFDLTVYDSGSQRIGGDLCRWYADSGWRTRPAS